MTGGLQIRLDHLAVSGAVLAAATAHVEEALGVAMLPGGRHEVFATHNTLLGLADGLYLEAIAVDPGASRPERARWFDLDRFEGPARLSNWICATDHLGDVLAELGTGAGQPVALSRGDLAWRMAVPEDGRLPFDNLHPALIEWNSPVHPSVILGPSGCALRRLVIAHPDAAAIRAMLDPLLTDPRVIFETGAPEMMAEIETPGGMRDLR